jgi:hypothetical protein
MCKPSRWLGREASRRRHEGREAERHRPMTPRVIAAGVLASLWRLGRPMWAVEYRWPVVNLDALTVLAPIDHSGPAPHGEARQSHLDARLDHGGWSAAAAPPERRVHRLHAPGDGGTPPAWRQVWRRAPSRSGWRTTATTMAEIRSRAASASRGVARRSRAIRGGSRPTHGRHASGVSRPPHLRVCPQAVPSTARLIPVCCAVATHPPAPGDVCVTASQRCCGSGVAETRR